MFIRHKRVILWVGFGHFKLSYLIYFGLMNSQNVVNGIFIISPTGIRFTVYLALSI